MLGWICFLVLFIWCSMSFLCLFGFVLLYLGKFPSMNLLKTWSMPLMWNSSLSSVPIIWSFCPLIVSPISYVSPPCFKNFSYYFLCGLILYFIWILDILSSTWSIPVVFSLNALVGLLSFSVLHLQFEFSSVFTPFYLITLSNPRLSSSFHWVFCLWFLWHHSDIYSL